MDEGCKYSKESGLWGEKDMVVVLTRKGRHTGFIYCLYSLLSASFMVIIKSSENRSPAMIMLVQAKWQIKRRVKARDSSQTCPERH